MIYKVNKKIIVGVILAIVLGVLLNLAWTDSMISDETVHIPAGYLHVFRGDYNYNSEHPPLANDLEGLSTGIFNRIKASSDTKIDQWVYGDNLIYNSGNNADKVIFWGRFPIIILTILLLYLVFVWSNALWGFKGGIVSLLLAATCPNLLANGHLATTDLILALAYTLNFYLLWRFVKESSWRNAIFLGLAMGFVLLAKFSGVVVLLLNFLILLVVFIRLKKDIKINALKTLIAFLISIFVLWLVYLFSMRGYIKWLFWDYYHLNHWSNLKIYSIDFIKLIFWPFKKYYDGFMTDYNHNWFGHLSYLNGKFSQTGRWQYFFYALLYKTPIPAIILFFMAIITYIKERVPKAFETIVFVLLPLLVFFAAATRSNINIGIRHILPIFPLAYIFIGFVATGKNHFYRYIVFLLVALNIIVAILSYPRYLAYFNQFAGGTKGGVNHLSDSNLDWNQNLKRFSQYVKTQQIDNLYFECYDNAPLTYYGIKFQVIPKNEPVQGLIAMCAQQYLIAKNLTTDYRSFILDPPDEIFQGTIFLWKR